MQARVSSYAFLTEAVTRWGLAPFGLSPDDAVAVAYACEERVAIGDTRAASAIRDEAIATHKRRYDRQEALPWAR